MVDYLNTDAYARMYEFISDRSMNINQLDQKGERMELMRTKRKIVGRDLSQCQIHLSSSAIRGRLMGGGGQWWGGGAFMSYPVSECCPHWIY